VGKLGSPETQAETTVLRRLLPRHREARLVVAEPLFSQQPRKLWIMSMAMLSKQVNGAASCQGPRSDQMSVCCRMQG
jgi:hypothetical protein